MIWAVAVFALGRWLPDLRGLVGLLLVLLAVLADYVLVDLRHHDLSDVMFVLALMVPPYVLGRITRRLAEQKVLLEEREELVKREAVRAERDRIARELHDVIAHSVSAMVVQTAAAQDLVRSDPERTAAVLADVADTGRRALAETGRLLHVIRDEDDELGLRPGSRAGRPSRARGGVPGQRPAARPRPRPRRDGDPGAARRRRRVGLPRGPGGADQRAALRRATAPRRCGWPARPRGSRSWSTNPAGGPGQRQRPRAGRDGRAGRRARRPATHGPTGDGRFELAATLPVAMSEALRVVVADDQDLVRSGLEMVLAARGVDVVGAGGRRSRGGRRWSGAPRPTWC